MWIGVDDTDGPEGGCTTHVLTEIVRVARERRIDAIGDPRLVRLNPNIPWKTRGNGALAVRLGHGQGRRSKIGEIDHRPVWSFPRGATIPEDERPQLVEALWDAVREGSGTSPRTDPAMVAGDGALDPHFYDRAVCSVVPLRAALGVLDAAGFDWRVRGSRRGLIGATAAVAWPGRRATWELLAYRSPARVGLPRRVGVRSVQAVQAQYPSLFLCYDARTRRAMVSPHTRCPILFGLRSRTPRVLAAAARGVRSERVDRWLRFRTNQGSGDHVRGYLTGPGEAYSSGRVRGTVGSAPVDLRGGHVRFELLDPSGGAVSCLAFEPSKTLPAVARSLREGESVEVWGGRGADPTFRVEGIVLGPREQVTEPGPRPRCPHCDRRTRSMGRARGYRCPGCHTRLPPEARPVQTHPPQFGPGTHHPTPSARRHLAPLGPEPHPP